MTTTILSALRRVLPTTFRGRNVEITNPLAIPSWAPGTPWLVDSQGSVFVRLA